MIKMDGSKIESGIQLFSRLNQRRSLQNLNTALFEEGNPNANDLIEITGASGTGKTLLLMDLLAKCLLPKDYNGKDCGAILINTNHHFDLFRLIEMIDSLIRKHHNNKISQSVVEKVIEMALSNLIVLNCYDFHQLQITFLNLEKVLSDHENISLLAIDGLSSYYWEYRNINSIIISLQNYHSKILDNLLNQIKSSNLVTIFTTSDVEVTLNTSWKITLKDCKNKFQAIVKNYKKNTHKTIYYAIEKSIIFLS